MKPPGHLSREAKRWWNKLDSEFKFSSDSYMLLVSLMECYDEFKSAQEDIRKNGFTLTSRSGVGKKNPSLEMLKLSRSHFLAAWRLLGFDRADMPEQTRRS